MWMLMEPIATTTASRTEADDEDSNGIKYLKSVLAVTIRSEEPVLEILRECVSLDAS